ncbi:MAG TPA: TolC family protein [Acidobacteriaceae bacterium]|nr:TolC family protein [Acidobacteriaceae bacterium]
MPHPPLRSRVAAPAFVAFITLAMTAAPPAKAQQISFYTAVDLALRNSHEVKMATADVDRAAAGLRQTKDAYVPGVVIESTPGYSYGFPVGQPSLVTATANSLLLSFSQPAVIRAARAALLSAQASLRDTRDKVVANAALSYIELDTDRRELEALEQQHSDGERLVEIERERNTAGLSSAVDVTQAELVNAQLELRRLHIQDHMSLLRLRLANLTGLTEDAVTPEPASIPQPPAPPAATDVNAILNAHNAALAASEADVRSKQNLALGDSRKEWRPQVGFGVQYSRYAKFNNYAEYYLRFQHNNFDVGIDVKLPIFDAEARDRAHVSAADAVHAREQANLFRLQIGEQTRELSGGLAELRLQQKIARLQSDYAQENLDAVMTQIQNGSGNPNANPLTPRDEEKARIEERRRYVDKLEADFQLMQAEIQLQRSLGTIEEWAMQASHP